MNLVNRVGFASGLAGALLLSSCGPKHESKNSLSSSAVASISDDVKEEIKKLQEVADDQDVSLESLIRTIYSIVNPGTSISEMIDPNLAITLNPCKDDDIRMRNLVDSVVSNHSPWEAKKILLEFLSKNPELLREFKKSDIYTKLLFKHSDNKCREPEVTFRVSDDAKLYAQLDFCGESFEKDIGKSKLPGNLDWLRDHEQGTCNDKVLVFPNSDSHSIEVQQHSSDIFSVVGPDGIILTGDLSVLVPEMHRQEQNIEKSAKAKSDPHFYQISYVSPQVARLIKDEKKTIDRQIDHVIFVFKKHFGENIIVHRYNDQSIRVIVGEETIKINLQLMNDQYLYSHLGKDFLDLNELIWWLDTNHLYSYPKKSR